MGPVIIFDKSTLQSLNPDEAVWLDAHYLPNITPLFFIETLADLHPKVAKGRTPEQIVGNIAEKTPPNAGANVHHRTLCINELLGGPVTMVRHPVVDHGQPVRTGDQRGVFFATSPEMKAFTRWQNGEFSEIERECARAWRRALSGLDLEAIYGRYRCKLRSLEEVKQAAEDLLNKSGSRYENLKMALDALQVPERSRQAIRSRWKSMGGPVLAEFAPYTAHVLTVDLFFNLAIGADLISRDRPSNKIDIAYLYYLPFCMIFASNDRLHERTAKCFLKANQMFLLGKDLKAELARLDAHYSLLPQEVKDRGVMSFAGDPPHEGFLTTRLWDRFMRPDWRVKSDIPLTPEREAKIVERINRLHEAAKQQAGIRLPAQGGDDFMLIEHSVPVRMGKWRLVPPEAEKSRQA